MKDKKKETSIVKAPIEMNGRGIVLKTFEDSWRFATCLIKSGLAPSSFRTPEAVMIAIQYGAELGMPPMLSLQSIAVVNGRATIWGDRALAMVKSNDLCESIIETHEGKEGTDTFKAVCVSQRKGEAGEVRTEFSVADARQAGLWDKQGPWKQYPKRMLTYRARGFNLRDNFPDVLQGMHLAEEMQDVPPAGNQPYTVPGDTPAVHDVIDVTPEPTELQQLATDVTGHILEALPLLDEIPPKLVTTTMSKLAARANHDPETDFSDEAAWTPEIINECREMLKEHGLDPEWLPEVKETESAVS